MGRRRIRHDNAMRTYAMQATYSAGEAKRRIWNNLKAVADMEAGMPDSR